MLQDGNLVTVVWSIWLGRGVGDYAPFEDVVHGDGRGVGYEHQGN
jgi:hypothetical protein